MSSPTKYHYYIDGSQLLVTVGPSSGERTFTESSITTINPGAPGSPYIFCYFPHDIDTDDFDTIKVPDTEDDIILIYRVFARDHEDAERIIMTMPDVQAQMLVVAEALGEPVETIYMDAWDAYVIILAPDYPTS